MKETPFTRFHIAAGAKMAPFAGFTMPVEFSGINDEHLTVREAAGWFDVSHMGEIMVEGPNALDFLQYVTTNDVSLLVPGKIQYTCFPNGQGGIVDDLLIYCLDEGSYLLVVNASNIEKDWNFLCRHASSFGISPGKELRNVSDRTAQVAVQGPLAMKIVQSITEETVEDMLYYTFRNATVAGIPDALVSATGYTGSGGCEIYLPAAKAEQLWNALTRAGEPFGMKPVGLGARDTLRLEMGFCLYGNDIDDSTSPLEAGLGWITKFAEGKNFLDREFLSRQKKEGVARKLVGFEMIDRGIPRHGYEIADQEGNVVGRVTSGTMSPSLKCGIGMGYVPTALATAGTEIRIVIRGRNLRACIVPRPFYKKL